MPKYRPETEKLKAKNLTKSYIKANFNQSELAKREGVTSQAINQRLKRKPVQDILDKYLSSTKLKKKLKQVAQEGLEAKKVVGYLNSKVDGVEKVSDEFVEVPDQSIRHRFWRDLMSASGKLKTNGEGGVKIINIIYGYRTNSPHSSVRNEGRRV